MFDPLVFPYERVQTYADGGAPDVLADEFYNPVQDALARLYGAGPGLTMSIACEEFDREGGAVGLVAGAQFGLQLVINTSLNSNAIHASPIDVGDHGIWVAQNDGGGAHNFIAWDNAVFIGTRQFIWSARVRFNGRAAFETLANYGFVFGLWGAAVDNLPAFRFGSDTANFYAYYNDGGDQLIDTGITADDDKWYTLIVARGLDSKLRWYIGEGTGDPVLVATSAAAWTNAVSFARRMIRCVGTGGSAAGEGFWIDFIKRGIER